MNTNIVKNQLPLNAVSVVTFAHKAKRNKKNTKQDHLAFVPSPVPEESHDSNADVGVLVEDDLTREENPWVNSGDIAESSGQFDLPGLSGLFDYLEARTAVSSPSLPLSSVLTHLRAPHSTYPVEELVEGLTDCGYKVVFADQLKSLKIDSENSPLLVLLCHDSEWVSCRESVLSKHRNNVVFLFWNDSPQPPAVAGKNWLVFDLFAEPIREILINTIWSRLAIELDLHAVEFPCALLFDLQQLPDTLIEPALLVLANAVKQGRSFDRPEQLYTLPLLANLNPDLAPLKPDEQKIQEACIEVFGELNHHGSGVQCFVRNKAFWQFIVLSPDPLFSKATKMTFKLEDDTTLQLTVESPEKISLEFAVELVSACNSWNFGNAGFPAVVVQFEAGIVIQQYLQFELHGLTVARFKSEFERRITKAADFWRELKLHALGGMTNDISITFPSIFN